MTENKLKKIVILGGGFAGLYTMLHLQKILSGDDDVEITLVSQDNYILYTPMLAEVVASSLDAKHVISPIRGFLKKASFKELQVLSIDPEKRVVNCIHCPYCGMPYKLEYDHLVIALGSVTSFHGIQGADEYSFPLKNIYDAKILRSHVIDMFEHADLEQDHKVRQRYLTFVIVGGGYTGIEVAAELNDFVHKTEKFYKNVSHEEVKVIVVGHGKRIMHELSESLASYAEKLLSERYMEFHLNANVVGVCKDSVNLDTGETIYAETTIWGAGTAPNPVINGFPFEKDKRGSILVNEYLEVPNWSGIWAIGDCAHINDPSTNRPYPPTAQHAVREAKQVAKNIAACVGGKSDDKKPFTFSAFSTLAPLGHRSAVAEIKGFKFSGFFAWFMWRTIYLSKMPGIDRKFRIAIDWFFDLFFPRDIVQLKIHQNTDKDSKHC